jgi:hypothetical protein
METAGWHLCTKLHGLTSQKTIIFITAQLFCLFIAWFSVYNAQRFIILLALSMKQRAIIAFNRTVYTTIIAMNKMILTTRICLFGKGIATCFEPYKVVIR